MTQVNIFDRVELLFIYRATFVLVENKTWDLFHELVLCDSKAADQMNTRVFFTKKSMIFEQIRLQDLKKNESSSRIIIPIFLNFFLHFFEISRFQKKTLLLISS